MNSKKLILRACVGMAGWSGANAAEPSGVPTDPRPNIIFMFADDWGWGDLSSHNHPYVKTPNLDRLRDEGTDFMQFNVLNPVCSPSRTAVMTGHYPARYSIHQHIGTMESNRERGMPDWLDPDAVMLPRMLQHAGYATAHYGKWHLTSREFAEQAPLGTAYGYDDYAGWNGPLPGIGYFEIYDKALDFLRAHRDQPVFINLWLHEAHTPHEPSEESMAEFAHLDKQQQVYAAVIADGDKGVGKILNGLDEMGIADNTLLVFSSDNGPEVTGKQAKLGKGYGTLCSVGSTGGLRGRKRSLFEGGVRVPFIVRWPGRTPARKINENTVVTAVDLLPTFCAAAGAGLPEGYEPDGENLLAALLGEPVVRRKPVFWEWRGLNNEPDGWPQLAVRDGDWKLVMTQDQRRAELYNLTTDREESRDLSAQYPEVASRLIRMAQEWKRTLPEQPDPACRIPDESTKLIKK